jgi:alpha/beta superfamily hydrolase
VYRLAQACRQHRIATLRFNFRGVGESRGIYSGTEEYRDVEAAAAYLKRQLDGSIAEVAPGVPKLPLALAGYSFGSIMVAMAATGAVPVGALALVALVVAWEEMPARALDRLAGFPGPVLAVCGDSDDLAPPLEVERTLTELGVDFSLSVVHGADHLFEGRQREVGEHVAAFLDTAFACPTPAAGTKQGYPSGYNLRGGGYHTE